MAKKNRKSKTQRLEQELQNCKNQLKISEDLVEKLRDQAEDSFLGSATFIQIQERIKFAELVAKSSEMSRIEAAGRMKKYSDLDRKLYADNKKFLEHDGESDYFIGIIECYEEINEVLKYKNQTLALEGQLNEYKDIVAERDEEIKRLQEEIANLKHECPKTTILSPELQYKYDETLRQNETLQKQLDAERKRADSYEQKIEGMKKDRSGLYFTDTVNQELAEAKEEIVRLQDELKKEPTTTALSPDMKKEYDKAIEDRDYYERRYEQEKSNYYEEREKNEKLSEEIESLKLQLSEEPTTDNVSDEELDHLTIRDIRNKSAEEVGGKPFYDMGWYDSYGTMDRSELVKRVHYVETISERRKKKIDELKVENRNLRFARYSQEDAITYVEALREISSLKYNLNNYKELSETWFNRAEELQAELTELKSTTLPLQDTAKEVAESIKADTELRKKSEKKRGRPNTITDRQRALIIELSKHNGASQRQIARQLGISLGSVNRVLNEE